MTDSLQVGIEATLGLDIGMAHKVAHLSFLAADLTLFTHGISSIKSPSGAECLNSILCIVRTVSNSPYFQKRQVKRGEFSAGRSSRDG